ncbi:hypothetical protein ACTFR9_26825 [Bacillus cereus group sp. MYBK222-1]|uniref:hypothetical protein n=1 Tax=Bacillus cereus group sp. MYBK222-1 TaxID=3450659 RepID=UPI003F7B2040
MLIYTVMEHEFDVEDVILATLNREKALEKFKESNDNRSLQVWEDEKRLIDVLYFETEDVYRQRGDLKYYSEEEQILLNEIISQLK